MAASINFLQKEEGVQFGQQNCWINVFQVFIFWRSWSLNSKWVLPNYLSTEKQRWCIASFLHPHLRAVCRFNRSKCQRATPPSCVCLKESNGLSFSQMWELHFHLPTQPFSSEPEVKKLKTSNFLNWSAEWNAQILPMVTVLSAHLPVFLN